MPLPRTRTIDNQDVVLSNRFASAATAETLRLVSPIAGFVERIHFVRGGAHDATEVVTTTIRGTANAVTLVTGGAVRDVDTQELGQAQAIGAGEAVAIVSTGSPAETTIIGVFVVIRRL